MKKSKEPTIGDQPIQPEFRDLMNNLARGIDEILNDRKTGADRRVGFVLLVFNMNQAGERETRCNYISNADRLDIVAMMKDQIARFEGAAPWPPDVKAGHA